MNLNKVKLALQKHGSKRGALVEMGFARNNSCALKKLSKVIKENNLEEYLIYKNNRRKNTDWSEEKLRSLVSIHKTYTDILKEMNLVARGENILILKNKIKDYGIDTSHFDRYAKHYTKPQDVFIISKDVLSATVKKKFLDIVPYKCSNIQCGISEWNNEKICLELDHINGVCFDHRIENLRLLCPNCHSQTPTHRKGADKKFLLTFENK